MVHAQPFTTHRRFSMQQHAPSGSRRWLWTALGLALLSGCARVNDAGMRLVSSNVDAYLIVNGQYLTGDMLLIPDRTGRASFSSEQGAIRSCGGGLRYTASNGGELDLRCSDGTQVALQITLLSETRGYGYAGTAQGPASVAYGLSEQDARGFLTVPAGMALARNTRSGALGLQSVVAAAAGAGPTGATPESPEPLLLPASARGK
jgi:hypothetical protein